jgi:TonB-linked SusC/RagA family outer membrane protein
MALLVPAAFAQTGTVTGTVTDAETGETIPGANVALTEINRGAATNPDGEYTISSVPVGTYTLRVSFVGYSAFETEIDVQADQTTTQDVALETGAVGLDEVVVTGYGTQRRADISGSIANVDSEEIQDIPVQNTEALLQGRAAGVRVMSTSGNPGNGFEVNVRGEGSINAGDDPLYIVDGVQVSFSGGSELNDRSPLNAIDPKDIESIEVLKDAAAASIYGAQAANGVVLITTKSGREGATQVSLRFEGGVRFQSQRFDMMNRDEWVDFQIDAFGEDGFGDILEDFGYARDTPTDQLADYDWQDFIFEPGGHTSAGFTATGGDANTQFYLSGNWQNTDAATQKVSYEAFNFRSNLSQQFTSRLNVDLRLALSSQDSPGVCQDGFFINCPFYQSIGEEPPISFPFLSDAPPGFSTEGLEGPYNPFTEQSPTTNPALVLNEEERDVTITQIIGNIRPTYRITSWLSARGALGLDWQQFRENDYESTVRAPSDGGFVNRRFNTITNLTTNLTLNARETFAGVHNVSALAGSEYRREFEVEDDYSFTGMNNDLLKVPDAATQNTFFQGFNTEYRLLSYFGNVNYNYDNRYIASFTGRYDGTSRFGADRRWGFFPSGSIAWRVSEEEFFTTQFVDDLKVRLSYGITGNSSIGNFASRGLYDVSGSYEGQVGIRPDQLANPLLTWEEEREINFGLDWSLWRGRLTGALDMYRATNDQLLLDRPLPESSGYGEITENIGQIQNQGIEFSVRTVNVQTDAFRWSTRLNFAVNQNEVKELSEGVTALDPGDSLPIAVGHSLEAWKVPIWAGVNPADGRPMYFDADGNITYDPAEADEQFFDGGEDDVVGGFGTSATYKGLTVDVFFDYAYGATSLPSTQRTWTAAFGEGILGRLADVRWREPGDIAEWPRATPFGSFDDALDPDGINSYWLYRRNYLRLKNASLSYRLPAAVTDLASIRGARLYVSGFNLLTWTSYLGIDPEVGDAFEESSYPQEQQFNFGIEVDL